MTSPYHTALAVIRKALLNLDPSGDQGFEGLIAEVLARMTGLVMRLAKSGSQFGRDATTPEGTFAVAMEAKRYREDMTLEELAGKIVLAQHILAGLVDLYVLGVTSAVGDQIQQALSDILAERGITLLTLDWTEHPIPPLAVALAANPTITVGWFEHNAPAVDWTRLTWALDEIRKDAAFESQESALRESINAANVGFEPLRRKASLWLEHRLSDASVSQEAFGQFVTVVDPVAPAIHRPTQLAGLATQIRFDAATPRVVVILADEGMGKTWLVAQWWIETTPRPIQLLVAGRRVLRLDVNDTLGSLAALLAEQHEGHISDQVISAWRKRLERWKLGSPADVPRFVVVLDGLNERQSLPWADLIGSIAREVHRLGGIVVVTCRPSFWSTDVKPRLRPGLDVIQLAVTGYTDSELAEVLKPIQVHPDELPAHVREFIRNPRVCRVAAHVLRTLRVAPHELTVERLLFVYWQQRLEERGNLLVHNVVDFHKLLRAHARAWLESDARPFDRNEWLEYSNAARRLDLSSVRDDLAEIEEGRFLTVYDSEGSVYQFRTEVLPFALALLITAELKGALARSRNDVSEGRALLAQMLDPIRGFDVLSEAVAAAVGLACLDPQYSESGRIALILSWLTLQNVNPRAEASIEAVLTFMPIPFLDALETEDADIANANGTDVLMALILARRDAPSLIAVLNKRIVPWLGRWVRYDRVVGDQAIDTERQDQYEQRREEAIALLTSEERAFIETHTIAIKSRATTVDLGRFAARILASRPLAPYANGLMAWAFASQLTADWSAACDDIRWICRLNIQDPDNLRTSLDTLIQSLGKPSSDLGRLAYSSLLYALGDAKSTLAAVALAPLSQSYNWTRAEQFCDVNPYDPTATNPTNLDEARRAANTVEPNRVWVGSFKSVDDIPVDDSLSGLTRFDADLAIEMLQRVVLTAPGRAWDALRSLSWHLIELAPIFNDACVAALEIVSERLLIDPHLQGKEDYDWVITAVSSALASYRSPQVQLDHLVRLPATVKPYYQLRRALVALPGVELEQALADAISDDVKVGRILLFASGGKPNLTARSRDLIIDALSSPHDLTVWLAAETILVADDPILDERLLDIALRAESPLSGDPDSQCYSLARTIAAVVIRQRRVDAVRVVASQFLGVVVASLGSVGDPFLTASIDRILSQLLQLEIPSIPAGFAVNVETSIDGLSILHRLESLSDDQEHASELLLKLGSAEIDRWTRERKETGNFQYIEIEKKLESLDASSILTPPPRLGLAGLIEREPECVKVWVEMLLAEKSRPVLAGVANFGYVIASAYSRYDAEVAMELFRHLSQSKPFINVLIGPERISLQDQALFCSVAEVFDELKYTRFCDALDDATIADVTLAAELSGETSWLNKLVENLLGSATSGHIARGLVISGFRRETVAVTDILQRNWGIGFLGSVAAYARAAYERAQWTDHWLHEAGSAIDGPSFWRAMYLAENMADNRALRTLAKIIETPMARRYDGDLYQRFWNAGDRCRNARKKILFGQSLPGRELIEAFHG